MPMWRGSVLGLRPSGSCVLVFHLTVIGRFVSPSSAGIRQTCHTTMLIPTHIDKRVHYIIWEFQQTLYTVIPREKNVIFYVAL